MQLEVRETVDCENVTRAYWGVIKHRKISIRFVGEVER